MTVTQSVIFSKDLYDTVRARRRLKVHHFTPIKRVHETTRYLRYHIKEPDYDHCEYRTNQISNGIKMIVGIPYYVMFED